ncbi:MAG: ATP synthase F1 subunit delta [Lachnospiraceae bacterium]
MAKLVSKVYGDALFEAALDGKTVDAVYQEAIVLHSIFEEHEDLAQLLAHPQISKAEKLQAIQEIFGKRVSDEMMGLLTTIVKKDRQHEIPEILDYFIRIVKEYKKIGTAYVTSAVELNEDQKARLKAKLLETTAYQEFEMVYQVDSSLIGGMVIRIGDRVVDSSIKMQLNKLKRQLMAGQVEG